MASGCETCGAGRRSLSGHALSVYSYLWQCVVSCVILASVLRTSWGQDWSDCDSGVKLYATDLDLKFYRDSPIAPSYNRYLYIDEKTNYLFVGSKNKLNGFFLENIANSQKRITQEFNSPKSHMDSCSINGHDVSFACQNHIRFMVRTHPQDDTFYMCTTGSFHQPTAYFLELRQRERGSQMTVTNDRQSAVGVCPYDPSDNSTAILIDGRMSGGFPFLIGGTYTDSIKSNPAILRSSLSSGNDNRIGTHEKWLNEPQFVASFEIGDSVYIFFREVAQEYTSCGKKIYSRIAKVCKDDTGGERTHLIKHLWTSFVKARLNCSIPGEYPYYFDEIQDVIHIGDDFYALFTTNVNGITASAICVYSLRNIQDNAFSGEFKEQSDKDMIWKPISESRVPKPRPGNCSAGKSQDTTRLVSLLTQTTMLMDKTVRHKYGKPIFYQSNVLMRKFVGVKDVASHGEMVFFAATNTGTIHKIAAWPVLTSFAAPKTYTVSTYIPFTDNQPIWDLKIHKNWIYFGTDMVVGQIAVEQCDQYRKIDLCIYDPYCGWDRVLKQCQPNNRHGLIDYKRIDLLSYSLEEAIGKRAGDLYTREDVSKFSGSSVTLSVDYLLHIPGKVTWTRNNPPVLVSGKRFIMAQDNSLVITELHESDQGNYKATDDQGRTVSEYTLRVETNKQQIEQRWIQKFDQWCDEFERYQEDIRHWEKKCESCCQDSAVTNALSSLGGK